MKITSESGFEVESQIVVQEEKGEERVGKASFGVLLFSEKKALGRPVHGPGLSKNWLGRLDPTIAEVGHDLTRPDPDSVGLNFGCLFVCFVLFIIIFFAHILTVLISIDYELSNKLQSFFIGLLCLAFLLMYQNCGEPLQLIQSI